MEYDLIVAAMEKSIHKQHAFFSNSHKYQHWHQDKKNYNVNEISELYLQCLGYGQYIKEDTIDRFQLYFKHVISEVPNLKNIRIKLNGFDLDKCPDLIKNICSYIEKYPSNKIKLLQISTTKLKNCNLDQHFIPLFKLGLKLGKQQRTFFKQNQFQSLSLIFSDWEFGPEVHEERSQPGHQNLKKALGILQEEGFNTEGFSFNKFRLELSTWYYTDYESKLILDKVTIDQFHKQMKLFVEGCYNLMPHLSVFQLDLRNWNPSFRMKELKNKLLNLKKDGTSLLSINSKNFSKRLSTSTDFNNQNALEGKLFEAHFFF